MAIRRALTVCLALVLAPLPALAAGLEACRPLSIATPARPPRDAVTSSWLKPVPENPVGCTHGIAFEAGGGATLWRCQVVPPEGKDLPEGTPEHAFLLMRPGQPVQVLPDELMAGKYQSFDLIRVDLDGDGSQETVLAAWNTQGNGMGVHRWTIRVFDAGWKLLATFPEVVDWGNTSLVRAPAGRRGCDIAITRYVESVNRAGRPGISLEARFQRLNTGALAEATDRPAIRRRYDRTFEAARTRHFDRNPDSDKGDVARWLSHRDAQAVGR